MADALEQVLLELGIDLTPVNQAKQVLVATMGDLNRLSDQYVSKSKSDAESQLSRIQEMAQAAVSGAMAAIAEEKKKQAVLASQTAELDKQVATQKLGTEQTTQGLAAEQAKLSILQQQTEARRAELLELQKQNLEERRNREEESRRGEEGFANRIGGALLRRGGLTSLAASVAGGFIGGELAVSAIEHIIEKLKEVTREAGSISLLDTQFRKLAAGGGEDADKMLADMTERTEGLVDRFHLLQTASAALKSHMLTPDEISRALGAIVKVAEAQGKTAEGGIEAFTSALSTGRAYALSRAVGVPTTLARPAPGGIPQGISPFERQSIQMRQQLQMIEDYAAQLGELPQTFEQTEKRISVSIKNIFSSFGQGINESPGAQVFLQYFTNIGNKMNGLQDLAKKAGVSLGDAFGGAVTVLKMLEPVLATVWDTVKDIVSILGSFAGSVTGFDHLQQAATKTREEFEQTHPILVKVVGAFAMMVGLTQKVADNVNDFVKSLKENETLIKAIGAVALLALGPEVAIGAGLIGAGIKRGAFQQKPQPTGLNAEHLGHAPGKKDVMDLLINGWTPGQTQTEDWEDQLIDQMNKAQAALGSAKTGAASMPKPSENNLAEQRKLNQALLQAQVAAAKERLTEKQADIDESKRLDDNAYRDAEETLQAHLAKQLQLAQHGRNVEQQMLTTDYEAKKKKATTDYNERVKALQPGVSMPPEEKKAYELQMKTMADQYQASMVQAERKYQTEAYNLRKQNEDDQRKTAIKGIQDQLGATKDAIKQEQQALQDAHSDRAIDPDTYYQKRIALIHLQAIAEIAAAQQVYDHQIQNQENLEAAKDKFRQAEAQASDQIFQLQLQRDKERVQYIQSQFGTRQQILQGRFTVAQAQGDTGTQLSTQESMLQNQENLRTALEGQLVNAAGNPVLWEQLQKGISDTTSEIVRLGQAIQQLKDKATSAGSLAESLGTLPSEISGSKFMRQIGEGLTRGGAEISTSRQRGEQIGAYTTDENGNIKKLPMNLDTFAKSVVGAAQAVQGFVASISQATGPIQGGVGGAVGGAGLGSTIQTALGATGPWGAIAGAAFGGMMGIFTGQKMAQVRQQIDHLNTTFKDVMHDFQMNTNNLQVTITQLTGLVENARQMQAMSKKGSSQYQQFIDQTNQQIMQLEEQQVQVLRNMNQQVAILSAPIGAQSFLSDLQQILQQYQQFEGAAQTTQDLANATNFLTESLQNYELNLSQQLLQDNTQAINDALQLNDLLWQRNQMILDYNQQVSQIMSQGVLTRQMTRAQTAGQQIYMLQINYQHQMEQITEQINAAQYRVAAEGQIFNIATTRIGLETQLLALQNQQTGFDMARIAALSALVQQFQSGNLSTGALGALLSSLQGVTPGVAGANTDITAQLEKLFAGAYQDRASMGYGQFAAQNL